MNPDPTQSSDALKAELEALRKENEALRRRLGELPPHSETVRVPEAFRSIFDQAQQTVGAYFKNIQLDPSHGSIEISGQRYLLVRASALSYEFLHSIRKLYADRGDKEAISIGRNFLFDIAHLIGMEDARAFHTSMNLTDPIEKLSAGPVHFAYTGWAFVDMLPESRPTNDEDYYIKYHHPFSFEADSWIREGQRSEIPVCIMNAGYSSGWCEASFGMPLTAVEISCKARGDEQCTFIMAPPHRIQQYLETNAPVASPKDYDVPAFLERKKVEEELKSSLRDKEVLLKEIHHRVKNNLQVISSLLNLQASLLDDARMREKFQDSIDRVRSMAILHELLYGTKDLSRIRVNEYLTSLVDSLKKTYYTESSYIRILLELQNVDDLLDLDKAVPFGLIINELVSNAFKYAFVGRGDGQVSIRLEDELVNGVPHYRLTVADNGVGLPADVEPGKTNTLGLDLVCTLSTQLDGDFQLIRENGTRFVFLFRK